MAEPPKHRRVGQADKDIGQRIRLRRVEIEMSQQSLADELGLAFQQVQKYETGINRVTAPRLQHIATTLRVPISVFKRRPMQINGEVCGEKRQALVDEFQAQRGAFDAMILSPRAGGVGLTLTSANHVIHLSRWWNPAVEDQCTDRVYRIGQERTVLISSMRAKSRPIGSRSDA